MFTASAISSKLLPDSVPKPSVIVLYPFPFIIRITSLAMSSQRAWYINDSDLRMTSPRNSSQQQRICKRSPNILTSGIRLCLGHSICCNSFWIKRRSINNLSSLKNPPSWQTIILYVRARGRLNDYSTTNSPA